MLITLIILVIMATTAYTLSVRVLSRRHRDQYLVDYNQAQYACASGMKLALASLTGLNPQVISRPNEPDFSDLFVMSEQDYQAMLAEWIEEQTESEAVSDANDPNGLGSQDGSFFGLGTPEIRGPYGPRWPLVRYPVEFEIGSAQVTVEIEDENAKYPLGLALLQDEQWQVQAQVGFTTFCEWMGYTGQEIDALKDDLTAVAAVRPFKTSFEPIREQPATTARLRTGVIRGAGRTTAASRTATARRAATATTVSVADQIQQQRVDFAKIFHSSLIDADLLSRRSLESDSRKESAMKYLGLWGTSTVNINTATRNVLEAVLCFASIADAPKIAQEIIVKRQVAPFDSVDDLKRELMRYSSAIETCEDFLATSSTIFMVRVTAVSGLATANAVAAVTREGETVKTIAVMSD
jgi:hypothetical protein